MNAREAEQLVTDLYGSQYSILLRYATRVSGSLHLAEDVVQEAFMRLYRDLRRGHNIDDPRGWTFSVVRHEIAAQRREQAKLGRAEPIENLERGGWGDTGAGGCVVDPLAADDVERLLACLSPREAEVVLLRLGNLKYREIAAQLGISVKAVSTFLGRALSKLRPAAAPGSADLNVRRVEKNEPTTLQ